MDPDIAAGVAGGPEPGIESPTEAHPKSAAVADGVVGEGDETRTGPGRESLPTVGTDTFIRTATTRESRWPQTQALVPNEDTGGETATMGGG
jgi:hypothetical protein